LLREGLLPKLPKRSPRKRDDYKCGNCGMKKRNHYCVGESVQEESEPAPASKKRKKSFKPLTVLLIDNVSQETQQCLDQIRQFGESNIEVRVRYVTNGGIFSIFAEATWENYKDVYIGKLSDFYKEYVKASIDDGTLAHIELTPIEEVISPELNQSVLMAQLTLYRSTSWRTKRLSEVEWRNTSKKKKFKRRRQSFPFPLRIRTILSSPAITASSTAIASLTGPLSGGTTHVKFHESYSTTTLSSRNVDTSTLHEI